MLERKIELLKRYLDESVYTVAVYGSGMMEEGGYIGVKNQERAYEIEEKYGVSPEEIFTGGYYNTRPEQFFRFYKNEMLKHMPEMTESIKVLAAMEKAGKLQCVITANIFGQGHRAGIRNFIDLHGNIYNNKCPHCQRVYPMEYVRDAKGVPLCEHCGAVIRPQIALFGEMVESSLLTRTIDEIERADLLLVLGTTLNSEVYRDYFRHFNGRYLVVIHQREHFADQAADLVIIEQPKKVLPYLGY